MAEIVISLSGDSVEFSFQLFHRVVNGFFISIRIYFDGATVDDHPFGAGVG